MAAYIEWKDRCRYRSQNVTTQLGTSGGVTVGNEINGYAHSLHRREDMNWSRAKVALTVVMVLMVASAASAQITGSLDIHSISGTWVSGAINNYTVNYSINIPGTAGGSADVMLLTDTTGSMSSSIFGIQSAFSGIVTALQTQLPGVNIHYAVADYKDYLDGGNYTTQGVNLDQAFTGNTAAVQTALNGLFADGGNDGPESNLKALQTVANSWGAWVGLLAPEDPHLCR